MTLRVLAAGLAAVIIGVPAPLGAADNWVEVTSPHFRVISNNGERSARETAWQFEEIRAGIGMGWPWAQAPLDRPLLIIGMKDEATMKAFSPEDFEKGRTVRYSSVSASDWDRHYIAMRADLLVDGGEGVNPYRIAYWTYCDLMLSSSFHSRLPIWLTRGLAAVLSNTNVTEKELQFGRAVPSYVQEFKSGGRFPLDQLFTMTRQAPEFQREIDRRRFDAECWALMHYLVFGEASVRTPDNKLNKLAAALTAGVPSVDAVQSIYGSLADLDAAYRGYVDRGLFRYITAKTDIQISPKDFSARPAPPALVAEIRAAYLAASNRPVEAKAAIDQARQLAPTSAATYEVEGLMLEHSRDLAGAQAAYEKAIDLKSENFLPYVRLAVMTQRDAAPEQLAKRRAWLERSIALNGSYPQSQQWLGSVLQQMGETEAALIPARRAVALNPGDVFFRTTLAQVLGRSGKKDEALKEMQVAQSLARTDQEKQSVQATLAMLDRIK